MKYSCFVVLSTIGVVGQWFAKLYTVDPFANAHLQEIGVIEYILEICWQRSLEFHVLARGRMNEA